MEFDILKNSCTMKDVCRALQHKGDHMLYLTITKELPRRRQTAHTSKKTAPTRNIVTISLLNPPSSYRLKNTQGRAKVVKLFI